MGPLSSRQSVLLPPTPGYPIFSVNTKLKAAERKWRKSKNSTDHSMYQSLLLSFSIKVHIAKTSYFQKRSTDMQTLQNIQFSPLPPSTTSYHLFNTWWFFLLISSYTKLQPSAVISQTLEVRPTTFTDNNLSSSSSSLFICCSKVLCIEIRCSKQKTALTLMEELRLQMFFSFYFAAFSNSFFFLLEFLCLYWIGHYKDQTGKHGVERGEWQRTSSQVQLRYICQSSAHEAIGPMCLVILNVLL